LDLFGSALDKPTTKALIKKYVSHPQPISLSIDLDSYPECIPVDYDEIKWAVASFQPGTAGGLDGHPGCFEIHLKICKHYITRQGA